MRYGTLIKRTLSVTAKDNYRNLCLVVMISLQPSPLGMLAFEDSTDFVNLRMTLKTVTFFNFSIKKVAVRTLMSSLNPYVSRMSVSHQLFSTMDFE